ncbi:phosphopantetheine-binding protein [Streptomyces sp. O3]
MNSDLDESTALSRVERQVAGIWTDVLGAAAAEQRDATFFELSGESIAAVRIVTRIEDEIGAELEVGDLFEEDPTLAALVRLVVERIEDAGSAGAAA